MVQCIHVGFNCYQSHIYTALEVNGVQILNGDFSIQGTTQFTAAGNEFQYVRDNSVERVFTTGPLVEPLTLQVTFYAHNRITATLNSILYST